MPASLFQCIYCGRSDFLSKGGLEQHVSQNTECRAKESASLLGQEVRRETARDFMALTTIRREKKRNDFISRQDRDATHDKTSANHAAHHGIGLESDGDNDHQFGAIGQDSDEDDHGMQSSDEGEDGAPDQSILLDFLDYECRASLSFHDFTPKEQNAIELMSILRQGKASLRTYEAMMEWHLRASNKLRRHENLASHPDFIGREPLINMLLDRYNLKGKTNIIKEITLPSSRARATIIKNDAKMCLQSLLTDPRITDDDYLFFDDNPLSPPLQHQKIVAQLVI